MVFFLKNFTLLLLITFLEGGIVMCIELNSGSVIATTYGNSVYLWAGVLGFTLAGLAAGYFTGAVFSRKDKKAVLKIIIFLICLATMAIPFTSRPVLETTLAFNDPIIGLLTSCFLLIFPALFLCGTVCPLVIARISSFGQTPGKTAGIVYTVSTLGGVLFSFLTLFLLVPQLGIRNTYFAMSAVLCLAVFFYWLRERREQKDAELI